MKILMTVGILLLGTLSYAQDPLEDYQNAVEKMEKQLSNLWEGKEYDKAKDLLTDAYTKYQKLDQTKRKRNSWKAQDITYNLACVYSLKEQNQKAVNYVQAAIDLGYKNYFWFLEDSDLDNIRSHPDYNGLAKQLKGIGDYKHILRSYPSHQVVPIQYVYQADTAVNLADFRIKYKLDSVAGMGDSFSKILNLMQWVHEMIPHDGSSSNPKNKSADAIISKCKEEGRGFNCRMLGTVLNEACLSLGIPSRFVTCMPKGIEFNDCHVINTIYSDTHKKWIWMDPSFNCYVTDDLGNPLNIPEVRQRLIDDLPLKVKGTFDWNGQPYHGGEQRYLHEYMAKNLFRFSSPAVSQSAYESIKGRKTYLEWYPANYNPDSIELDKIIGSKWSDRYVTNNELSFWQVGNRSD